MLFVTTAGLIADLLDVHSKGDLADRLVFYAKPRLLILDELGYLPFERQAAHLFFSARHAALRKGQHDHHD